MLTSENSGKYLSADWAERRRAGELDSSTLTAAELSYLEIRNGERQVEIDLEKKLREREKADGVLHLY